MGRRGRTLALLAAIAALALLPAQAQAGKWIDAPSTAPLGESAGVGTTPAVAISASGAEIVAWYEGQKNMALVRQPGGGPFGAPMALNVPAAGASIGSPNVAIDAAGDVLVAWTENDGAGHYSVQMTSAGPGQQPGVGAAIPGSVGAAPKGGAQPLFLSDGTALIMWSSFEGALEFVMCSPGGSFGPPVTLAPNEVESFAVVPESGDRALVTWTEASTVTVGTGPSEERTTTHTLKSADISATGAVSGKQTIDTRSSVFTPSCTELFSSCTSISLGGAHPAADPAGDGLISYVEISETGSFLFFSTDVVKAAYRAAGGGFEAPVAFPPVTSSLGGIYQGAGLLGDGTALVAWEDGSFGSGAVRYAQRSRAGAFPAAGQVLAPGSPSSGPQIAALGANAALIFLHNGKEVLAQEFSAGGPQGNPVALSANDAAVLGPVLAGDGSGDAVAGWERRPESSSSYEVEVASYDAGPRLSSLAVPASGLAGAALPFAVTAVDPLSPVTAEWTFGDGVSAAGTNVSHAYAAPGAQTASVVARDAAGLVSTSLAGVTQVAPAPHSLPAPTGGSGRTVLSLKVSKQRLRDLFKRGLAVTVGCSGACTLNIVLQVSAATAKTLGLASASAAVESATSAAKHPHHLKRRPVTVGRATVTLRAPGTKTIHVKLTRKALRRLRHVHKLTLSVVETASGAGAPAPLVKQITLR